LRNRPDAASHQQTFANIDRIQGEIQDRRLRTVQHRSTGQTEIRLDQPTPDDGRFIAGKLRELADQLATLPDPEAAGQSLVMPPSQARPVQTHTTNDARARLSGASTDGEIVEAMPLSINPGSLSGSAASAHSPLYDAVNNARPRIYEAGHLLSAHVYGPGTEFWNLTPITRSANRQMSTGAERGVHDLVFVDNRVVHYKITAHYPSSPTPGPVVPAEGFLPREITYIVKTMKLDPSVEATAAQTPGGLDAARRVPGNWVDDTAIPFDPVRSDPPLNDPLGYTPTDQVRNFICNSVAIPRSGKLVPSVRTIKAALNLQNDTILTAFEQFVASRLIEQQPNKRYYFL
jgi:hypothetical protein